MRIIIAVAIAGILVGLLVGANESPLSALISPEDRVSPLDIAEETKESLQAGEDYLGKETVHLNREAFSSGTLRDTFIAKRGPEAFIFNSTDAWLYRFNLDADAGTRDAELRRHVKVGRANESFYLLDGKVDSDGKAMVACEATLGLVSVSMETGHIQQLLPEGTVLSHCAGVDLSFDSPDVYFTDAVSASAVGKGWNDPAMTAALFAGSKSPVPHSLALLYLDYFKGGKGTGRLLRYNRKTGKTKVLLKHLNHASGVAVSPDGQYVLVVEGLNGKIIRKWVRGPMSGSDSFALLAEAFGLGIARTESRAGYWVTSAFKPPLRWWNEKLYTSGKWRSLLLKFLNPAKWWPEGLLLETMAMITGIDTKGMLGLTMEASNLAPDASGMSLRGVRSVVEHDGILYLGQTEARSVPAVPIPGAV
jgi:Strictosidine synthase